MLINQQHIYISLKKLRTFLQGLNDSQRYNIKNFARIKRKRALKTTILSIIASIKYIIVAILRNTLAIVFLFKLVIVAVSYAYNHNILVTYFHCDKFDHIKSDYFNFDKFSIIRIREIVNEFDNEIKKIFKPVDEVKKV